MGLQKLKAKVKNCFSGESKEVDQLNEAKEAARQEADCQKQELADRTLRIEEIHAYNDRVRLVYEAGLALLTAIFVITMIVYMIKETKAR